MRALLCEVQILIITSLMHLLTPEEDYNFSLFLFDGQTGAEKVNLVTGKVTEMKYIKLLYYILKGSPHSFEKLYKFIFTVCIMLASRNLDKTVLLI